MSYGFSMVVVGVNGRWEAEDEAERPVEDGHRNTAAFSWSCLRFGFCL
jgi:hypothetical protein